MKYQKIKNLLDNTPNQPSKFRTKNWVKISDDSHGKYNINSQIKFKTMMLMSSLCDYSDAYILVKGTITVPNTPAAATYNAMLMYNLAEYSDNYSKTSKGLWQYYSNEPALNGAVDQLVNNDIRTYNILKIATGQGDDYTTDCLLDCVYFKNYYKMIAIELSKQQALDADLKAIQGINFTGNLDQAGNTTMF